MKESRTFSEIGHAMDVESMRHAFVCHSRDECWRRRLSRAFIDRRCSWVREESKRKRGGERYTQTHLPRRRLVAASVHSPRRPTRHSSKFLFLGTFVFGVFLCSFFVLARTRRAFSFGASVSFCFVWGLWGFLVFLFVTAHSSHQFTFVAPLPVDGVQLVAQQRRA